MPYKAMRLAITKSPGREGPSPTAPPTASGTVASRPAPIAEGVVFDVTTDRLVLMEGAPGIHVCHDVLDHIGFEVRQAEQLTTMDAGQLRPCLQIG
jgi:hypothetical protein